MTTKYMGDGIWVRRTNIDNSDIMVPVDLQSHHQETIQTHTGVVVSPSTWSQSSTWIDTSGFDRIALTLMNDTSFSCSMNVIWSHDGSSSHGEENTMANSSGTRRAVEIPTKARYAKVAILNGDTAPHTMSAWAYLKA